MAWKKKKKNLPKKKTKKKKTSHSNDFSKENMNIRDFGGFKGKDGMSRAYTSFSSVGKNKNCERKTSQK